MLKRIGLIILFAAVTIGIGVGLYFMIFGLPAPTEEPPPTEPVNKPGVGLPPAEPAEPTEPPPEPEVGLPAPPEVSPVADGGVTQVTPVSSRPTRSATLSETGTVNYYDRSDGRFYRMLEDGTVTKLTDEQFFNVDKATFAPNGDSAILEYPDGANIHYDFSTGKQVTLPTHWEDFDFSPEGDKIASKSIGVDQSNRFIVVSNPDGSGAMPVQELGENADEVDVDWSPNNQVIATATTGRKFGVDRHEVYFIGQHHENFRSMTVEGLNFQPKWSPTGEQLLYSAASQLSDWKPRLWTVDASGDDIGLNRRMINVDTWAEKCTYQDNETLYCAVPEELPRGAGLQPRIADDTPDDIIKIDLRTGLQTQVAIPEGNRTVENMMLSPDGTKLYFTEKGTGFLNEIKLRR